MRILIVHDYGAPTGGAEILSLELRRHLRSRGHEVQLFTSSAAHEGDRLEADATCFGTTGRGRTLLQCWNPWARSALRRTIRRLDPDVVHLRIFLTQLSPSILPVLRKTPTVLHVDWYRSICPRGTKQLPGGRPCTRPAGRACLDEGCLPLRDWVPIMAQMGLWRKWRGAVDRIVAASEPLADALRAGGLDPDEVIETGVSEMPARPPLMGPPAAVFAGRLVPEKGADVLLRAFATVTRRVPGARLTILGDGPERQHLERLRDELGLSDHVCFRGHLTAEPLRTALDTAWVQAVPSTWAEPFGLVAAEALMRGTAVVASGSGGLGTLVDPGRTGLLVPPGDDARLADALIQLLGDVQYAETMGRAARATALERFDFERFIDRFEALYAEIAGRTAE